MDTVRRWMTSPAIVALDTMVLPEARQLMHEQHIRRLPVVDATGRLVGIVSKGDIHSISDSHTTDVREFDLHYRVSDLPLGRIMTRNIITVAPETSIVEVAHLMLQHKIGGIPVVAEDSVVGIITESDLFRIIITLQNAGQSGEDEQDTSRAILERLPSGFRQKVRL